MKLINEGNGFYGVEHNGCRVLTGESYQVASNVVESNGGTSETDEVYQSIKGGN